MALRERRRRLHLVRWGFTGLFGAGAVLAVTTPESSALSFVTAVFCAAWSWSIPHLQAHHALRTVSWQGEYRTSVSETGIAAENAHATLVQRWPVFRGYRETRDHVVLLSRDPNILLVEVLPKRGAALSVGRGAAEGPPEPPSAPRLNPFQSSAAAAARPLTSTALPQTRQPRWWCSPVGQRWSGPTRRWLG